MDLDHSMMDLAGQLDVLNAIPDLVVVKDLHSKIVWANSALGDFYGLPREALRGRFDAPFVSPELTKAYLDDDRAVVASGLPRLVPREVVVRRDGVEKLFSTWKSPIVDKSGRVTGIAVTCRELLDERPQSSGAQGNFLLASILHEVRNELGVIQGLAAMLGLEKTSRLGGAEGRLEAGLAMKQAVERMARIMKDTEALFAGGGAANRQLVSMSDLIEDAFADLGRLLVSSGIVFRFDRVQGDEVRCNRGQIVQVLRNLLTNAVQAVSSSKDAWVAVDIEPSEASVRVRVRDNGAGVPNDLQGLIFDPFVTTKPRQGGTGIGLAISQRIAKSHQGHLRLVRPADPTCFELCLPRSLLLPEVPVPG